MTCFLVRKRFLLIGDKALTDSGQLAIRRAVWPPAPLGMQDFSTTLGQRLCAEGSLPLPIFLSEVKLLPY